MADKQRVDIEILGQKYPIRSEAPAEYVRQLASFVDQRAREIRGDAPGQDAVRVLGDDVTFSLEHGYQDRYANGFLDEFAAIMERDGGGFIRDLAIDPPKHTRLRKLTEKAFTAHRVKDLEPRIRQIVVDLVEQVAARGSGDGMKDIAGPLTAHIICEQLGFDYSEVGADKVAIWTKAVLDQIVKAYQ